MTRREYLRALLAKAIPKPWEIALAVATVVGVVGALVTWLVPSVSRYVNLAIWFVPTVLFFALLACRLVIAPYWLLNDEKGESARLRARLEAIEDASPRVIIDNVRQAQLYRQLHTAGAKGPIYELVQIWFKNQPAVPGEKTIASSVAAEITFDGPRSLTIYGQWAVNNPPSFVGSHSIAAVVDIPPGPLPVKLNLALKYPDDSYAYAYSEEGVTRDIDGRDKASELPSGTYQVKIRLQGVNLDQEYEFRLENPGAGRTLQVERAQ